MEQNALLHLQNGSDVRGVACEGIPGEEITLTPAIACRIGCAFAKEMAARTGKEPSALCIAVGRDSRITGEALASAFMQGVTLTGASALDCGLATTPSMFMALIYPETACDASCMVTASHLPFNRNGLKFFTKEGGFEKSDIKALLTAAAQISDELIPSDASANNISTCKHFDLLSLYADNLCDIIRKGVSASSATETLPEKPLSGLHIVVDAGNGNGGFFATKVLEQLGADISGSQFLEPDGHFPNHIPNPENKEAMASICQATVASGADLGLIFDTDVDRMSAVFADGSPVNRDACIALASAILAPVHKGATIVTDSVTSDRLTQFLEDELGLKHLCFKRGYKNVINKCKELNADGIDCPLAMETSGHGCLKENYYLDDGAYLAVRFVIALAKAKKPALQNADLKQAPSVSPLQEIPSVIPQSDTAGMLVPNDMPAVSSTRRDPFAGLLNDFSREAADREVRFSITEKDFVAYGEQVLDAFRAQAIKKAYDLPHSYEGVRIRFAQGSLTPDFHGGWLLLRASLHDPVMVLNLEGRTASDLDEVRNTAKELLEGFSGLNLSAL